MKASNYFSNLLKVAALSFFSLLTFSVLGQHKTWEVSDGVYAFQSDHNLHSMFVITDSGAIVVDPINNKHAKSMLRVIRSMTDQPVKYVLYSHNHREHISGGKVFRDLGARTLAHVSTHEWLKMYGDKSVAPVDAYWTGTLKTLHLGQHTIELHYMGPSHGVGMTTVLLPKERVAYIADLVTPNQLYPGTMVDYSIRGLENALKKLEALDFEKAIYSRTANANPIGDPVDVAFARQYLEALQQAIDREYEMGTPTMKIPYSINLPQFANWSFYEAWLPLNISKIMAERSAEVESTDLKVKDPLGR